MSADQSLAYSRLSATKETSVPIGVWSSRTKDAPHPRGTQIAEWGAVESRVLCGRISSDGCLAHPDLV